MTSYQLQPFAHVLKAKSFPCREISATRAFPLDYGRNAQSIIADEHLKYVSYEKGSIVGCERTISEPRPSENTVRNESNHVGEKVQQVHGGYACRRSLMGTSNSHSRQGKHPRGRTEINVKKRKATVVGKSLSALSEKKHRKENLGGPTTKMKVPPKGKVVYIDPDEIANFSRDRAIKALNLFRIILKEEQKKSKEQGNSTNRIDMAAYNRLKITPMWVNSVGPTLGSVPWVEVGDKFQYRVELSIIGLHHPLEAGIDYLQKDGKFIATSIVFSGCYDNDTSDLDALVYCGQGGKYTKGDKRPKDQKLELGNLALKNSIDQKNVVRVILGSKEVQHSDSNNARGKIASYFVYIGFYVVEKYSQEIGDSGASIFKFHLRRVLGQLTPNLRKNQKKQECCNSKVTPLRSLGLRIKSGNNLSTKWR
ncbi:histone-lysine N-methyltransferase, H3 lysine-9 specific SUVH6-like [Macadamia integrifolia]|uniref:histone-lysine N-methyltransferase, H3 lysine-9 specific SUVH6-like n=1 Tax=Macadamia integrifolia TaxID=60698 RepID=UPI001C4F784A|nr:histone-lysine N-methyltransferase, H3 lysine-9 specific SUVH6-like [Macadamia integrifolia]XP_042510498.1 histone-lysine N-methyltransferase, H3 lysine-9 specific SUVH6-like [Macadamia integrifolia]